MCELVGCGSRRPSTSGAARSETWVLQRQLHGRAGAGSAQLTARPAQRPACRLARSSEPWARGRTRPESLRPADGGDRLQGPCAGLRPRCLPGLSQHTLLGCLGHGQKYCLGRKRTRETRLRPRGRWVKNLKGQVPALPTPAPASAMLLLGGGSVPFSLKTGKYS